MRASLEWYVRLAGVAIVTASAARCASDAKPQGPTVVVLCIEALRYDYPDLGSLPALQRLAAEGGRAGKLIGVFPSNSLPSQAAIATGLGPAKSGVVNNRFHDRRLRQSFEGEAEELEDVLRVEPLWVTAARQGVPTATIHWNGADEAGADEAGAEVPMARRSKLNDDATDAARVEELLDWIAADDANAPRLILVYLDELDEVAHQAGPDSPEVRESLARYDGYVGRVAEALARDRAAGQSTLLVLGDHGMASVSRCVFLRAFLSKRNIPSRPVAVGGSANVYLPPGMDPAPARAALAGDGELLEALSFDEAAARYGYDDPDRVGDLVLIGKPGVYFRDLGVDPVGPALLSGVHGYPPERPEMAGAFLAWGRNVPAGSRWPELALVDVYPTICALLGVTPAAGTGGRPIL